jgi:hypothetical protein
MRRSTVGACAAAMLFGTVIVASAGADTVRALGGNDIVW